MVRFMTEQEIYNIDWNTHCLKSTYHNNSSEEVYIKVFNVGKYEPSGFSNAKQLCFDCKCFDGQNYDTKRSFLRCCLLGTLYEVVPIPKKFKERQMTIFDFL